MPDAKYHEVIRRLRKPGFVFDRQARGSHEIWIDPATDRQVTVARHAKDMAEGTLRAILRTGRVDVDAFLDA